MATATATAIATANATNTLFVCRRQVLCCLMSLNEHFHKLMSHADCHGKSICVQVLAKSLVAICGRFGVGHTNRAPTSATELKQIMTTMMHHKCITHRTLATPGEDGLQTWCRVFFMVNVVGVQHKSPSIHYNSVYIIAQFSRGVCWGPHTMA